MEFGVKDANCLYACSFFVWLRKQSPWWMGGCLGWLVGWWAGLGHLDRYQHTCVHMFHSPVYLKRAMATTFSATKQQPTLLQPWLYKPFA